MPKASASTAPTSGTNISPSNELMKPRVLLALDRAGKPLADRRGAPLRSWTPPATATNAPSSSPPSTSSPKARAAWPCDIGPYYTPGGEIKSGYDHPLDIGQRTAQNLRWR